MGQVHEEIPAVLRELQSKADGEDGVTRTRLAWEDRKKAQQAVSSSARLNSSHERAVIQESTDIYRKVTEEEYRKAKVFIQAQIDPERNIEG